MHVNSLLMFERYATARFKAGDRVLEIGPDDHPSSYRKSLAHVELTWETLDVAEDPRLTYPGVDPYSFPIGSAAYDVVLAGQVLEHVPKIWDWARELSRITRIGGCVVVLSPVSWPYHEAPIDCWRTYPAGMTALFAHAGLDVVTCEWGSLECLGRGSYLPGRSEEWQPRAWRTLQRLFWRLGLPSERAYDCITVGVKRASA